MRQCRDIILAEKRKIRFVPKETFAELQSERIASLDPFMDAEGIIPLKTRITKRTDVGDFGIPAVLPSRHPIVDGLVFSIHVKLRHVGAQGLLSFLRENFWTLIGRRSIQVFCRSVSYAEDMTQGKSSQVNQLCLGR